MLCDCELDTREMAEILYKMSEDMDYRDDEETKCETVDELDEAFSQLKCIAENEHNFDFWRTLYKALDVGLKREAENEV